MHEHLLFSAFDVIICHAGTSEMNACSEPGQAGNVQHRILWSTCQQKKQKRGGS